MGGVVISPTDVSAFGLTLCYSAITANHQRSRQRAHTPVSLDGDLTVAAAATPTVARIDCRVESRKRLLHPTLTTELHIYTSNLANCITQALLTPRVRGFVSTCVIDNGYCGYMHDSYQL